MVRLIQRRMATNNLPLSNPRFGGTVVYDDITVAKYHEMLAYLEEKGLHGRIKIIPAPDSETYQDIYGHNDQAEYPVALQSEPRNQITDLDMEVRQALIERFITDEEGAQFLVTNPRGHRFLDSLDLKTVTGSRLTRLEAFKLKVNVIGLKVWLLFEKLTKNQPPKNT